MSKKRTKRTFGYGATKPNSDTFAAFLQATRQTTLQTQTPEARATLRDLARNEFLNNQHAGGIARLFGLYVVGTGPRLKFKGFDRRLRREVDREMIDRVNFRWERFADEIRFASKLRHAMQSLVVDGEAFLCVALNPKTSTGFDVRLLDPQRVGNPDGRRSSASLQDGVYLDAWGNPEMYCVYDAPDSETYYRPSEYQLIGASQIMHLFREDLPGQTRGVTWFAAALPLLHQLREYTAAVVETAKKGARFVSSIETQAGFGMDAFHENYLLPGEALAEEGEFEMLRYDAWNTFRTPNGDSLVLPPGTTQKSFDSSQPTSEAAAFTANILGQIGYSMGLPRNKATGSSHEYNFASGRLDNQPFEMLVETLQRDSFERSCCDRLFKAFYQCLEPELLMNFEIVPEVEEADWEWVWPKPPLVDAESTARTNAIRVQSRQATLGEVWNETHPYGDFSDVRDEFKRDARDFPDVYGAEPLEDPPGENTAISEPKV